MKRPLFARIGWLAIFAMTSTSTLLSSAPAAEPLKVKVLTFNIRCSSAADGPNRWEPRREWVADLIRRGDYDFIGIQEATPGQRNYLDHVLQPEYKAIGAPREPNGEGTPLYYRAKRWQLDPTQTGTFWLSETPDKPASKSWNTACTRIATWGRFVEQISGRPLYFYNTHFDHRSELARQNGAALILQKIAAQTGTVPTILTGDLNCNEQSVALKTLTGKSGESAVRFYDTFRVLSPDAANVGTYHAFTGVPTGEGKIDYVLVKPEAKVLAAAILREHHPDFKSQELRTEPIQKNQGERYPSDHFPVMAEVAFP